MEGGFGGLTPEHHGYIVIDPGSFQEYGGF